MFNATLNLLMETREIKVWALLAILIGCTVLLSYAVREYLEKYDEKKEKRNGRKKNVSVQDNDGE